MTEEEEKLQEEEAPERPDLAEQIVRVIRGEGTREEKLERLRDFHENDLADALPMLTEKERAVLFNVLGDDYASEILAYVEAPAPYLKELGVGRSADLIENMDADDAVDVLENLDDVQRQAILL